MCNRNSEVTEPIEIDDLTPYVTNSTALQIFVMSVSIAFIMVTAERIKNESIISDIFIKIMICYVVVFFEGAYFRPSLSHLLSNI